MRVIEEQKRQLRKQLRDKLKNLSLEDRRKASLEACEILRKQPVWKSANSVLFYSAVHDEIDVTPLIHQSLEDEKYVCFPQFDEASAEYVVICIKNVETDMRHGKYGILEPEQHCERLHGNHLDFILVPGLGFDVFGHRLGRGKGHYDRLLSNLSGVRCGLAFDCQVCDEIPVAAHDETVNYLLTPTRWLAFLPV